MGSTPAAAAPPSPSTTHAAAAHHHTLPSPSPQVEQCEVVLPDPRQPQPCPLRSGSMVHSFLPLLVRPDGDLRSPSPPLLSLRANRIQSSTSHGAETLPRGHSHGRIIGHGGPSLVHPLLHLDPHDPPSPHLVSSLCLSDPPRQVRHGPRPPWTVARSSGASLPLPGGTRTRTSSSIIASSSGC